MWIITIIAVLLLHIASVEGQFDQVPVDPNLTIDELILKSMGGQSYYQKPSAITEPNKTLAELDMILTDQQFESLYASDSTNGRQKRKAVVDENVYWTNGQVAYKFNDADFNEYEKWMIKVAMREWEKYTCVRFHEAGPADTNYINFQNGFGCNSQLGMIGGRQDLNLDQAGCRYKGLYLHEIAHALGVVHEHQRPIRDDYITILYENVEPNMRIWFNKYNPSAINSHNVDYELSSVMHYGIKAFSGNQKQTIRAKDQTKESEIGNVYAKELSFTDVEIVNRMYNCVLEPSVCEGKTCTGKGYLDQNCECICQDGSHDCVEGKQVDTSCRNNGDTRESWLCFLWARQGECERNPGYMLARCAKACGTCGDERKDLPGSDICADVYFEDLCKKWKDEVGDCRVAEPFMKKYCKKTCGYCNDFTLDRTPPQTLCDNSHSNDTACLTWARKGECIVNKRWMPQNCQKACFTCENGNGGTVTTQPTQTTRPSIGPRVTRTTNRPTNRPTDRPTNRPTNRPVTVTPPVATTRTPTGNCVNKYPDKSCDAWAKYNQCTVNPGFMKTNCMRSCKVCQGTSSGVTTVRPTGTKEPTANCVDTWRSPRDCEIWAKYGHCKINPSFMLKQCAKSCGNC